MAVRRLEAGHVFSRTGRSGVTDIFWAWDDATTEVLALELRGRRGLGPSDRPFGLRVTVAATGEQIYKRVASRTVTTVDLRGHGGTVDVDVPPDSLPLVRGLHLQLVRVQTGDLERPRGRRRR